MPRKTRPSNRPKRQPQFRHRSTGKPNKHTGIYNQVGTAMQAGGALAARAGAMSPIPQARLALSAGGVLLNTAGTLTRSLGNPKKTVRRYNNPNKKRTSSRGRRTYA